MLIGIIGLGIVGSACKFGFEFLGHKVVAHDIKLDTKIENLLSCEIVYLCVPTPAKDDGECDISIVESVFDELKSLNYAGIIAIKSTIPPGTTRSLKNKYNFENICFVPEFLRERCALIDFTENHDLCLIGAEKEEVFEKVKLCHGRLPEKIINLTFEEAEFAKYFNNVYNATLITFANSFYEICKNYNVNYTNVKNAIINRKHINDNYLECNDNFRGFGGVCLPKDTAALASMSKETNVKFFDSLLEENKKYKVTVYEGMRK